MTENERKITAHEKTQIQTNNENNPNENQNENPTFTISELCSKYIIEKLISQTITITHSKDLETNFGEFCFDYIKNSINPFLNGIFFSHEEETDSNKENENFYFKIPVQKEKNTWVEIAEPDAAIDDTYLQDRMKFEPYINTDDNDVIKDTLSEFNVTQNTKKVSNVVNKNKKKNKKIKENKKEDENQPHLFSEDGEYKGPVIEFPSFPLPEEKYINAYVKNDNTVEIKNLRREMEFEKLKKFQLKKIEDEKIRKEKLKQIALRNQKEFDGSNYTFDPNGKVISIHKQTKNFSKEFYNVRPRIGFGKVFPNDTNPNKKKKKRASNDENKIIEKTINNLERSIDPFNEDKTKVFAVRRTSDSEIKTSDLVRKIKAEKKEKDNKDVQIEYNNNNNDFLYKKISKINNNNNEPIIIGGNNYDFIIPEVGVIVKNDKNRGRKVGGFDYSKKYNRPTWEDCEKIINDSMQINNKRYKGGTFSPQRKIPQSANNNNNNNNNLNNIMNNNNNTMNDINVYNSADLNNIYYNNYYNSEQNLPIDYSGNNSSLNSSRNVNNYNSSNNYKSFESNSLIKNAYSVLKQSHNGLNSMSNSLAYSYNTLDYVNRKNNLINSIQLSKNMSNSNLHSLFDDNYYDNNNNYDENNYNINNDNNNILYEKEKNLFKNNLKNRKKLFESQNNENIKKNIDNINNFNSQIIRSQNWGTNLYSNPDSYENNYKKPHKTNHIKEMGYKIVTTKLPRERRLYNGNFEKSRDLIKNILFEES